MSSRTLKTFIWHCSEYLPGIGGFLFGYDTGVISGAMSVILQESRQSEGGDSLHLRQKCKLNFFIVFWIWIGTGYGSTKQNGGPRTGRKNELDVLSGGMEPSPKAWNFCLQYFQFLAENTWAWIRIQIWILHKAKDLIQIRINWIRICNTAFILFKQARVIWPLLCLRRPFIIFHLIASFASSEVFHIIL